MIAQTTGERTLTIDQHTATVGAWRRAYQRAKSEGVKVLRVGGEWYATSVSQPGVRHRVNGHCDCEGADHGLICKHLAAVLSARYGRGELAKCQACGVVGPVGRMAREYLHVGGQADREAWYCGEGYGHQAACPERSRRAA